MLRRLLFVFFALALGGLVVLFFVAKTGLVSVPLLTSLVYEPPAPTRVVEPGETIQSEMETQLVAALQEKLAGGSLTDADVTLTFSEETLTASLREAIAQGAQDVLAQDSSQVALQESGEVELFLPFVGNAQQSGLLLRLTPFAQEGTFAFDLSHVQVGDFVLPTWLHVLAQWPLDKLLVQVSDYLREYASINAILVEEGTVTMDGTMTLDLNTLLQNP